MKKNLTFLITSVIYFSDRPISYSASRSIFSPEQRLKQTIETVQSIRRRIPDAKIILLEGGLRRDLSQELLSLVDNYIYLGNRKLLRWAIDGPHKGLGEGLLLLSAWPELKSVSGLIFKISGRYYLNDNFNLADWQGSRLFFREYNKCLSTRLYAFDSGLKSFWRNSLCRALPLLFLGKSLEESLFRFFVKKEHKFLPVLGLGGQVAPDGFLLEE
jgi:hypothetical protein